MERKSQEKFTNILSVISRTSALLLGMAIVFAGGYMLEYQNRNLDMTFKKVDLSASVITSSPQNTAELFRKNLENKNINILKKILPDSANAQSFLDDAESWKNTENLMIANVGKGFFTTLLATTTGDSLHPYWGYFSVQNEKITKVFWGEESYGIIEAFQEIPQDDEYSAVSVVNAGAYPWPENDVWTNQETGEEVLVLSELKKTYTDVGETATLVFRNTENFALYNQNKGFRVILEEE